jgi:hypothetical protein
VGAVRLCGAISVVSAAHARTWRATFPHDTQRRRRTTASMCGAARPSSKTSGGSTGEPSPASSARDGRGGCCCCRCARGLDAASASTRRCFSCASSACPADRFFWEGRADIDRRANSLVRQPGYSRDTRRMASPSPPAPAPGPERAASLAPPPALALADAERQERAALNADPPAPSPAPAPPAGPAPAALVVTGGAGSGAGSGDAGSDAGAPMHIDVYPPEAQSRHESDPQRPAPDGGPGRCGPGCARRQSSRCTRAQA